MKASDRRRLQKSKQQEKEEEEVKMRMSREEPTVTYYKEESFPLSA